jgi:hypothetical protein
VHFQFFYHPLALEALRTQRVLLFFIERETTLNENRSTCGAGFVRLPDLSVDC